MAFIGIERSLVMVLVVTFCGETAAQSGCTSALLGLSPCLNYITGNSSTPSTSCCSQIGTVAQAQPQCLCSVLRTGGAALGLTINQTQALRLPNACNLQTPSLSQCNPNANGPTASAAPPATSPAGSPADSSDGTTENPDTPSDSDVPSGGGSKTVPSISEGRNIEVSLQLVIFAVFLVSWASILTRD